MSKKTKRTLCIISILAAILAAVVIFFDSIVNVIMNHTMGKDLPQLEGSPEVGKWYVIDIDDAVSSDGSKWQGYFRKGSENKVVLYFYGGGFSVNDFTAARSLDIEGCKNDTPSTVGKAEGDRFQHLLKKMVSEMQEQIPGCGIYIWDEENQKDETYNNSV